MKLMYLSNGQACYVKEQIGSKYIINKLFEYEDEHGYSEVRDPDDIVVDAVFKTPPVAKIYAEIKVLVAKRENEISVISELEKQKRTIKREIDEITKTQISNNKFIINRSDLINAKTLALFPQRSPLPFLLNNTDKSFRGLRLSLSIDISNGEERSWGYRLHYDSNSGGDYLCEKYGILINPTQEEIDATIVKRLNEFKFDDCWMRQVPDKYLTPSQIIHKKELIESIKTKEKKNLEAEIIKMQQKLSKLQGIETYIKAKTA